MTRRIFLHHHIFKNAGSTIDWILERNFQHDFGSIEIDSSSWRITESMLFNFLHEKQNLIAVSSHHLCGQIFEYEPYVFFDIVFVRHPIDRLRSIYDYYRKLPHPSNEVESASHNMSLGDFLKFLLEFHPHQINDAQVNILANQGKYYRPPGESDLELARSKILKMALLGSLEMFDESLVVGRYFLHPAWNKLDLTYKPQNVAANKKSNLEDRLSEIKALCGEQVYDQLLRMNQLDLRLLAAVNLEVQRRAKLVPDFNKKLDDFKTNCLALI